MQMPATARKNMILGQLFTNDISDKRILQAMAEVPRETFLPERLRGAAYVDEDLEVDNNRYLMEPLTFAKLLDLAEITPTCRVLNIGCLSGYSAAIIARLAAHVVAIDSNAATTEKARENFAQLKVANINVQHVKNMADGYAPSAPYDVIVIQGAVNFISETLGSQLAVGGRLVAVRNISRRADIKGGLGKGLLVKRLDNKLQYREHFDASCVLLPGFDQESMFAF